MQFIRDIVTAIPTPAWIGISVSLVVATGGLTVSTMFSSNVELEVANSKLVLSRQIAKAKELNSNSENTLALMAATLQRSQETNLELREQIRQLKAVPCQVKNQKLKEIEQKIEEQIAEPEKNIEEIEKVTTELQENNQSLEKLNEELVEQAIESKTE